MTQTSASELSFSIFEGDCREVMRRLPADTFDAVVTDPPYELGFMGKRWDRTGVAFLPETWKEVLRVAKPGAMLLAFGGTRTYHRLTCAIEDAGWEIRDCLMWLYGQGFPKSLNIGKHIPAFNGYGTALKPAWEPILLAMKPLDGTFAANAERWGVAGVSVEGSRIGTTVETWPASRSFAPGISSGYTDGREKGPTQSTGDTPAGRFPANLLLDEDVAGVLDRRVGEKPARASGARPVRKGASGSDRNGNVSSALGKETRPAGALVGVDRGDGGGPSRFFYCAKAGRKDRGEGNNHPTVKPRDLMRYLCTLLLPPDQGQPRLLLDPFAGSGSTGIGALLAGFHFVGIEADAEHGYPTSARERLAEFGKEEILEFSPRTP